MIKTCTSWISVQHCSIVRAVFVFCLRNWINSRTNSSWVRLNKSPADTSKFCLSNGGETIINQIVHVSKIIVKILLQIKWTQTSEVDGDKKKPIESSLRIETIDSNLPALRTRFPSPFGQHPGNFRPFVAPTHCDCCTTAAGAANFLSYLPPSTCRCSSLCDAADVDRLSCARRCGPRSRLQGRRLERPDETTISMRIK